MSAPKFNTVEVDGEVLNFEDIFQDIDGKLDCLLKGIVSSRSLAAVTENHRVILSQVIAVQLARTKMVRTSMHSVAKQTADSLRKFGFDPDNVEGFSIPTEQDVRKAALKSLFNLDQYISILNSKDLILIDGSKLGKFWISDNPVVLYNSFPYGDLGLSSPGIELYFPISSDLVIGLYCPSIKKKNDKAKLKGFTSLNQDKYTQILHGISTGGAVLLGVETVNFLNSLQVINTSRFLYSSFDDFELAHKIISQNPLVKNVESRTHVGEMGMGMPKRKSMPLGIWVVVCGAEDHHLIKIDKWDDSSKFIDFETSDIQTLKEALEDKPAILATIFQDGDERRGMRYIKIEIKREGIPCRVRISHADEGLNKMLLR